MPTPRVVGLRMTSDGALGAVSDAGSAPPPTASAPQDRRHGHHEGRRPGAAGRAGDGRGRPRAWM